VLNARGDDSDYPLFASQPIATGAGDVDGVTVVLSRGTTVSGKVVFPPTSQAPPVTDVRITALSLEQSIENGSMARVDKDGNFVLQGLAAGPHLLRTAGQIRGFVLESVVVGTRDMTDVPLDLRAGQNLSNVVVTFTDKISQISGTITDTLGTPLTEYTVLAFPTDRSLWRAQARQIMTARPDQTGKYTIRGLPPGEYYIVPVDPAEQGEWFEPSYLDEHRAGAQRLTLSEGDAKTQDFKLKS
jgi:hypothetical protein